MRCHTSSARGFTMVEIVIVVAMSSVLLLASVKAFQSSDGLVQDARVRTRAESQHRRDLQAITNFLREADITTLSGFDDDGVATAPSCARVTGADLADRTYGPTETLQWVEGRTIEGVGRAGRLDVTSVAGSRTIADRVPLDGFRLRQEGSNLVIELTTFWRTNAGRSIVVSGSTVVAMRNRE